MREVFVLGREASLQQYLNALIGAVVGVKETQLPEMGSREEEEGEDIFASIGGLFS